MSWTYAEEPEHIRLLRDSLRAFVAKEMPAEKVREWDKAHHFPADLWPKVAALGICGAGTLVLGLFPGIVLRFADLSDLTGAFGG